MSQQVEDLFLSVCFSNNNNKVVKEKYIEQNTVQWFEMPQPKMQNPECPKIQNFLSTKMTRNGKPYTRPHVTGRSQNTGTLKHCVDFSSGSVHMAAVKRKCTSWLDLGPIPRIPPYASAHIPKSRTLPVPSVSVRDAHPVPSR